MITATSSVFEDLQFWLENLLKPLGDYKKVPTKQQFEWKIEDTSIASVQFTKANGQYEISVNINHSYILKRFKMSRRTYGFSVYENFLHIPPSRYKTLKGFLEDIQAQYVLVSDMIENDIKAVKEKNRLDGIREEKKKFILDEMNADIARAEGWAAQNYGDKRQNIKLCDAYETEARVATGFVINDNKSENIYGYSNLTLSKLPSRFVPEILNFIKNMDKILTVEKHSIEAEAAGFTSWLGDD